MKNLLIAIRSLFKKGRHNVMKIVSLGVGLSVGLVLIAKVYFEQSYDNFFAEGERTYQVWEAFTHDGQLGEHPATSGGVSPLMKREIPGVEAYTRYTGMVSNSAFTQTESQKKYTAKEVICADSCFFDVFPFKVISGDPKQILSQPRYVMISDELAEKIGGDVVGKQLEADELSGFAVTIGGVYERIPENSHLHDIDMLLSMPTMLIFTGGWDGPGNLVGNDRYRSYIRLTPGMSIESIQQPLEGMINRFYPIKEMEKSGYKVGYTFHKLTEVHQDDPNVKRSCWLLGILAVALIFTAVMNYILIVISSIVNRSKEVAVHKCYGASEKNIHGMIFSEALLHVVISLVLAALLLFAFRETVTDLLGVSVGALFLSKGSLVLGVVCLIVVLASGLVPGWLFARIPVASAFRNFRESRRMWKLGLLFFQFIAAGFLLTLLVIIGRQYDRMVNDQPGYTYKDVAYCALNGLDAAQRQTALEEIKRVPDVKEVSSGYQLFYSNSISGNNISLPNDDRELFNIADLYSCSNGYLNLWEIPVIEGQSFREDVVHSDEVMVSRSFVEKMKKYVDWPDGVIGKRIIVSEHSQPVEQQNTEEGELKMNSFVICGVYEDFRLGPISGEDSRPTILFYDKNPSDNLVVKFHNQTVESMRQVQETINRLFPSREMVLQSYSVSMAGMYTEARQFRDSVMIGGLITLLISLIGLIGYTNDEVNRRRKELAVRRVNGATILEVIRLFLTDVVRIALPAVVFGGSIAYMVAERWLEQFSEKVPLAWYVFLGCGLAVLTVILTAVMINTQRAAGENPVNSLKSE